MLENANPPFVWYMYLRLIALLFHFTVYILSFFTINLIIVRETLYL